MEIVRGEPLRRWEGVKHKGVAEYSAFGLVEGYISQSRYNDARYEVS